MEAKIRKKKLQIKLVANQYPVQQHLADWRAELALKRKDLAHHRKNIKLIEKVMAQVQNQTLQNQEVHLV